MISKIQFFIEIRISGILNSISDVQKINLYVLYQKFYLLLLNRYLYLFFVLISI